MAASMISRRIYRYIRSFRLEKSHVRAYADRRNSTEGAFFIFVPEVPVDTRETNPIMRFEDYPKFSKLTQENIISGCAKLAQDYDSKLDVFLEELAENTNKKNFQEFCDFQEKILVPMHYASNQARVLSLGNTKVYNSKVYSRVSGQIERSRNERYNSQHFYHFLKRADSNRSMLTDEQRRLLDISLAACRLTGVEIDPKEFNKLMSAIKLLVDKEKEFVSKSIFHKSMFSLDIGPAGLDLVKKLPLQVRLAVAADQTQPDKGPWKINLLGYVYDSFMETCPRRAFRFKVWNSYHIVGTHFATDVRFHTFELPGDIRMYRWDVAQCLGYENYAEMAMETKMAGSVQSVLQMLDKYRIEFLPEAKEEMHELQAFARNKGFREELQHWDIAFYRRMHCDEKYKMSKIYRQGYFSLDNVLNTLFQLCEKLFQIEFRMVPKTEVDTWHDDVTVYDVHNLDGSYVSRLYLDPFARRGSKQKLDSAEVGRENSGVVGTTPITFLLLALNKVKFQGTPTLMSYKEVLTMFFQFGNALQQMLTTARYSEMSGQQNIESDALHVCAYVMQMMAKKPHLIEAMSEHYQSGEKLTENEISRLLMAEKHMKSFDICNELYKSAFDIECHLGYEVYWKDIQQEMYNMFMPMELHEEDWIWCSDPTLWVGRSHACAYYQNLWSEMLACNILDRFDVVGWDNEKGLAKVGKSFRDTFLSLGGGLEAKVIFRMFMGHDHSLDPFVKRNSRKSSS